MHAHAHTYTHPSGSLQAKVSGQWRAWQRRQRRWSEAGWGCATHQACECTHAAAKPAPALRILATPEHPVNFVGYFVHDSSCAHQIHATLSSTSSTWWFLTRKVRINHNQHSSGMHYAASRACVKLLRHTQEARRWHFPIIVSFC